jgi:hypothetical protein
MKIEDKILDILKKEFSEKQIIGVRFVKKISETTWEFRYTYQDGDYLSISDKLEAYFEGITLKLKKNIFISPGVSTIEYDNSNKKVKNLNK